MLPKGFNSAGLFCGIKVSQKKDLALIFSDCPCTAAGVFTLNSVKAHCVTDNQATLALNGPIQAIVANSGNANACTGDSGLAALHEVKNTTAKELGIPPESILSASTGIIGVPLPAHKITGSLPKLKTALSSSYYDFAEAILTTDLTVKTAIKKIGAASIVGVAKGSGMIHPNMATMLAFIVTDCELSKNDLQQALQKANSASFNQISVDGDTSTNDMVLLLANGASGFKPPLDDFTLALQEICIDLARQIVLDGEGATKIFEVQISGANSAEEAQLMARGVSSSSLVKSAIFGNDPNWGRLLAAAGQHGQVDMNFACVQIFDAILMKDGQVCEFDKPKLSAQMKASKEIKIKLVVGNSLRHEALAWGCDLTYDYVRINAEYTT